jgi:hypothetical protein
VVPVRSRHGEREVGTGRHALVELAGPEVTALRPEALQHQCTVGVHCGVSTTAWMPALTSCTCAAARPITSARKARPGRSAIAERQMLPVHTTSTVKTGRPDSGADTGRV